MQKVYTSVYIIPIIVNGLEELSTRKIVMRAKAGIIRTGNKGRKISTLEPCFG